jgi:cytochrome b involved in lipid metabolism
MGNCNLKEFTRNEIIEENIKNPKYILIDKYIYNIEHIFIEHPGGFDCLLKKCKTLDNCKEDFNFHSKKGQNIWNKLLIGKLIE